MTRAWTSTHFTGRSEPSNGELRRSRAAAESGLRAAGRSIGFQEPRPKPRNTRRGHVSKRPMRKLGETSTSPRIFL